MKKTMINQVVLEGRIFSHSIEEREVQNKDSQNYGTPFLSGTVDVAVDEEGLNVVSVHFSYVTEKTKGGQENKTYSALKRIKEEERTWAKVGKDNAQKINVRSAIALNDFINNQNELVSAKRVEGGFITLMPDSAELRPVKERNTFNTDMVITSVTRVEKDAEKNILEDYCIIRGAIFNFKNDLLPLEYTIKIPSGMKYFEDKSPSQSEPLFTRVWGNINSYTKTITQETESAFGEAAVTTYQRTEKEWVITGALNEAYDFGDESALTGDELIKAAQDREVHLSEVKKRNEEYKAQKASNVSAPQASINNINPNQTFNF